MLRCKVTPSLTSEGFIKIQIDWIEVDSSSNIGEIVASEEFQIAAKRVGCSYVSRATFGSGEMLPGTFWLDEEGRRHFLVAAEPGLIGIIGKDIC